MTMKSGFSIFAAISLSVASAAVEPVTTETTSLLRGNKVTRRRTVYPRHTDSTDSLVDVSQEQHHFVKLRGRSKDGTENGISITIDLDKLDDSVDHDSDLFKTFGHLLHSGDDIQDTLEDSTEVDEEDDYGSEDDYDYAYDEEIQAPSASTLRDDGYEHSPTAKNIRSQESVDEEVPFYVNEKYLLRHTYDEHVKEQPQQKFPEKDLPLHLHRPHRNDGQLGSHVPLNKQFAMHDVVEKGRNHRHNLQSKQHESENISILQENAQSGKPTYTLPTGLPEHFNETYFYDLFDAPFDIYEQAVGHEISVGEPFPIFSIPSWEAAPGIFSGFNKQGEALFFENAQFLSNWDDIRSSSTSFTGRRLETFIENSNFHSNLIIGNAFRDNSFKVSFVGLMISYYKSGFKENALIPLSRLEDFFHEASGQQLSNSETLSLDSTMVQDILNEKLISNTSDFYHPDFVWTGGADEREIKEQLSDIETIHFQKLYQLLIKRSFLFSYGYADCLRADPKSNNLRACLDYTFFEIVKIETGIRGALEDQILDQLTELDKTFHSNVKEACMSIDGGMIGAESCATTPSTSLAAYLTSFASL